MPDQKFDLLEITEVKRERAEEIWNATEDEYRKEEGTMIDVFNSAFNRARTPGEFFIAGMCYQRISSKNHANRNAMQALVKEIFDE